MSGLTEHSIQARGYGQQLAVAGLVLLCVGLLGCERPAARNENDAAGKEFAIAVATPKLMRPKLVKYT